MGNTDPLAHFTDRVQQIAAFDGLWDKAAPWVLVFDGMAGNGKSTLIEWLIQNRCQRDGVPWARADLVTEAARSNFADLLGQWEDGLSNAVPPPVWQTYRGRRREILDELNRQRVQITATQQFEATGSASLSGTQQQMDISKLLQHADRHARTCLTDEFLDLLCAVPGRLVLFLDTYETLQQAGDPDTIGWLWGGLLVRTHQRCAGLRVIVGSREKLDLAHDLLALSEQVQAFSPKDCDAFLQDCGLTDFVLRDAIYALTRGHPLQTNMAVELWRQGQETDRPVSQQEIREGLEARVPTEWLYGRIVDRLAEPLKSAARYGALLRRFNQEILNACLPEESPHLNDNAFREFIGRSFVERRGHYWACHDLVREAQIDGLRRQHPGEFDEFNHRSATFFAGRWQATKSREDYLEVLYHNFWTDEDTARNAWWEACNDAQLRGERAWVAELMALAECHDLARKPLEPQTQGDVLFHRAKWLYYGDEHPRARQRYEEARPIYHAIGNRLGEANCIRCLGDVHLRLAEYPLARQRYEEARPIYHTIGDRLGEANCIQCLGDVHLQLAEYPLARQRYAEARPIYHAIGDRLSEANCIRSLGDVHLRLAEYPLARQRYAEARPIFHAIGNRLGEANCIRCLGDVHLQLAEYPLARQRYEEARPIFHAIGDRLGEANCIKSLGDVHLQLAEYPLACQRYAEARPIHHAIGDRLGEANCIKSLGDVHLQLAEYPLARQRYAEAWPIFHAIGDRLGEANCIRSLGDVHLRLAEYPLARQRYAEARLIYHASGARLGEANCIRSLGDVHYMLDEYPLARQRYAEARPIYHAIGDRRGEAGCLLRLGDVAARMGDRPTARVAYDQAAALYQAIGLSYWEQVARDRMT